MGVADPGSPGSALSLHLHLLYACSSALHFRHSWDMLFSRLAARWRGTPSQCARVAALMGVERGRGETPSCQRAHAFGLGQSTGTGAGLSAGNVYNLGGQCPALAQCVCLSSGEWRQGLLAGGRGAVVESQTHSDELHVQLGVLLYVLAGGSGGRSGVCVGVQGGVDQG